MFIQPEGRAHVEILIMCLLEAFICISSCFFEQLTSKKNIVYMPSQQIRTIDRHEKVFTLLYRKIFHSLIKISIIVLTIYC